MRTLIGLSEILAGVVFFIIAGTVFLFNPYVGKVLGGIFDLSAAVVGFVGIACFLHSNTFFDDKKKSRKRRRR